ncbi:MAG: hypothetical protein ABI651_08280 [Verrucomicrobiota bacterium]
MSVSACRHWRQTRTVRGQSPGLKQRLATWLEGRGLQLNETKTRLVDVRQESIKFLRFRLQWRRGKDGRSYPHVEPQSDSSAKLRARLRDKLNHWMLCEPEEEKIKEANRTVKGWVSLRPAQPTLLREEFVLGLTLWRFARHPKVDSRIHDLF